MGRADDVLIVAGPAGSRRVRLADYLDADLAETAEREAHAWVKALRLLPVGGVPFRDRFTFRGDSLWWFAELYLHKMQVVNDVHRTLLALESLIGRERPAQLGVASGSRHVRVLARRVAERHGIAWLGGGRRLAPAWIAKIGIVIRAHAYVAATWWAAWTARRARVTPESPGAAVAAFVHTAFWRGREEQYVGPVLREIAARLPPGAMTMIGLGPQTSYRARTWRRRVSEAGRRVAGPAVLAHVESFAAWSQIAGSRGVWRDRSANYAALVDSPDLRRAAVIHGCDAWPLVEPVFLGIAYLQWPWSASIMDQLGAALDAVRPAAAVTYAEAGGWGRALVLEARRRGIPSVGLQHGFIYRHWLNYLHEADEMAPSPGRPGDRGFPCPTVTLLYDAFAAEHLERAGRYPAAALDVTGSARLDALVQRAAAVTEADGARLRKALGVDTGQAIVVVAAKFSQIGRVFPQLVEAAAAVPGVRLVVKPHPAETAAPYLAAAGRAPHVVVAPAGADISELTRVARLIVTVNSTAAVEAMVLGVPSLVLSLPSNLSPFVDAGAMAGVSEGDPIEPVLRAALEDESCRAALARQGAAFMSRYRIESDGRAAARAAERILALARARPGANRVS